MGQKSLSPPPNLLIDFIGACKYKTFFRSIDFSCLLNLEFIVPILVFKKSRFETSKNSMVKFVKRMMVESAKGRCHISIRLLDIVS